MHLSNYLNNKYYDNISTSDFSHPLKSVNKSLLRLNYDYTSRLSRPKSIQLYSSNTYLPCLKSITTDLNMSKNCYSSSPASSTSSSSETITSPTSSQPLSSNQSSFIFNGNILNEKNSFRPIKNESLHKSTTKPSFNLIKPSSVTTPSSASSFFFPSDSSSPSSNDTSQLLKQQNHFKSTLSINLSNRYTNNNSFNTSRIIYINDGDGTTNNNHPNKSNSLDRRSSTGHINVSNRSSSMNRIKKNFNKDIQLGLSQICISNYGKSVCLY